MIGVFLYSFFFVRRRRFREELEIALRSPPRSQFRLNGYDKLEKDLRNVDLLIRMGGDCGMPIVGTGSRT